MSDGLVVRTISGEVRGAIENGVKVFRGIPYAAPPAGEFRFEPPQPPTPWSGVRSATLDSPIAPQGRSRLAHAMGEFERPQSEDCLTLNVWTPVDADLCPVLFWIHGGAFSSGAGSLPWYSGERFAATGRVVVVSINYRLGALGFLCLPGLSDGNLGLRDQIAALQWVRDNIGAFGGDPNNVTVVGQSAGAASIAALMTTPSASGRFRRAVMQSTPFGRIARSREEAERLGRRFLELCGLEKDATGQLKTLPVAALLAAQAELGRLEKKFADAAAPFGLTIDGKLIPGDIPTRLISGWASEIDVMIGTTREEMAAFYHGDPEIRKADATVVSGLFDATCGNDARAIEKDVRRMRASQTGAAMIESLFTDHVFRMGSLRFAEMRAAQGCPTHVYQFDWQSAAGFQSCHCLEIPFVFDNFSNWSESPMLKDVCPAETSGITQAMHGAWTAFVRTGNPNHDALPAWPRYRREERMTMRFDSVIGPVGDLAGLFWRVPWGNVI